MIVAVPFFRPLTTPLDVTVATFLLDDLKVIFSDENAMLDMLNYLNNSEKYKLFVHEFTYPMSTTTQAFSVSLPIKVLYK